MTVRIHPATRAITITVAPIHMVAMTLFYLLFVAAYVLFLARMFQLGIVRKH